MPGDARKSAWHFRVAALWKFSTRMVGSTSCLDRDCLLRDLDSELRRDLLERPSVPTYTSYVEIKYKLSDLEVVLTNASTQLAVAGYFQTSRSYRIDYGNLLR
jgi:hypothetical protein